MLLAAAAAGAAAGWAAGLRVAGAVAVLAGAGDELATTADGLAPDAVAGGVGEVATTGAGSVRCVLPPLVPWAIVYGTTAATAIRASQPTIGSN